MYQSLLRYIERHSTTPLAADDIELIQSYFTPKKLRKGQYLLQEGEICKSTAFIVKGAMRQYSVDDKGTEHIIQLGIENWWCLERESFLMLTPSRYNIDAWEDTDLLMLKKTDYNDHLINVPAVAEMIALMKDRYASATQKRLHSVLNDTAEQRYFNLLNTYPEIVQRFPQYLIASYLGVAKETLSRLRSSN
ncbi:MAG: cyclic nucleotide-binding protein [Bacteroidota bacterium]|nr:cyclic nucleotide-binding protein [Bacteroidota bacterium]